MSGVTDSNGSTHTTATYSCRKATLQLFLLRLVRKNISKYRYSDNQVIQDMAELSLEGLFGIGEAIGIIATLFVILYFSRKQMQSLTVDLETKIQNEFRRKICCDHSRRNGTS